MKAILKRTLDLFLGNGALDRYLRRRYEDAPYPRGHFYSPLPDARAGASDAGRVFQADADLSASIDLRPADQRALFTELARYYPDFDWPEQPGNGQRFYLSNAAFPHGDAIVLYAMLRHLAPRRVIEVGSGFSSALMLDTRDRFLRPETELTFIEPYPTRLYSLLRAGDRGRCRVIEARAQDVPVESFRRLEAGDILFIDSSHVSKVGSDVNYLLFEVLPALHAGVVVHFHDMFWPFEYPPAWVAEGRAWNEQYLLRAFLMYNSAFRVLLFNHFLALKEPGLIRDAMPLFLTNCGCSLWLRKMLSR